MTKKIITAAVALALVGGAFMAGPVKAPVSVSAAASVEDQAEYRLTVKGEGALTMAPDIAYINVGVVTENADAAIAQSENAKLMSKVMDALKSAGIDDDDLKTTNYSLYKTYNYRNDDTQEEIFNASNTLQVTVNNLDELGSLIDTVSKSGANQIDSIRFALKDEEEAYQKALVLALDNAKGKASAVLKTYGKKAELPVSITETSYGGRTYFDENISLASEKMASGFSTQIQSGDIEISASVSVEYDYGK